MSSISSSGIDVTSLVASLMTVERQPLSQLQSKQTAIEASISSWGSIKSSFAALGDAIKSLSIASSSFKATASSSFVSATASGSPKTGTYSLSISALAKSQTLVVAAGNSKTSAVTSSESSITLDFGTITGGTLVDGKRTGATFSPSGKTETLTVKSGASLSDIADAINSSDYGVTAQTIYDGSKWHLSISSPTGAASSMKISVAGDAALSSLLSNDPEGIQNAKEVSSSADAEFTIGGIEMKRSSNLVSDAIDGLSITLSAEGSGTVSVTRDDSTAKTSLDSLISAWNATNTLVRSKTAKGGEMQGDSGLLNGSYSLRAASAESYDTGTYTRLSQIGISIAKDGTMSVDASKFSAAMTADGTSVSNLIDAFSEKVGTVVDRMTGASGTVENKISALNRRSDAIDSQEEILQRRLDQIEKRYTSQYTSLNEMLTNMSSVSSMLENYLASLSSK